MATTLPFMGQHVDPFEMTYEQREALSNEARHVDALVVVSGRKALRRLLREIRAIDTKFWLNAARYVTALVRGTASGAQLRRSAEVMGHAHPAGKVRRAAPSPRGSRAGRPT